MKLYNANERGKANHGWLKTNYSFSFADYYNPNNVEYGALRVLNDDVIAPKKGFPEHPHENMEIITIVTKGELRHKDSLGKSVVLTPGWIQVMSAGSGIIHSEFNNSKNKDLELFQIWIQTASQNIMPKHEEKQFEFDNGWNEVVGKQSLNINQDAIISIGYFNKKTIKLKPNKNKGMFLMVIKGEAQINNATLNKRDAISFEKEIELEIKEKSQLLLIEVPL